MKKTVQVVCDCVFFNQQLSFKGFLYSLNMVFFQLDSEPTRYEPDGQETPHYMCIRYRFCLFDSLRPINNLSVIKGRVFLG